MIRKRHAIELAENHRVVAGMCDHDPEDVLHNVHQVPNGVRSRRRRERDRLKERVERSLDAAGLCSRGLVTH